MRDGGEEQQLSRVFNELSALLFALIRQPHLAIPPHPAAPSRREAAARRRLHVSPVGFAALLLGASLALMLCGSLTFVIGCILMPWVLALFVLFYFVGIVSNLKAVLSSGPHELHGQLLPKFPII